MTKLQDEREDSCKFFRPNTGQQVKQESLAELKKKYKRVDAEEVCNYNHLWILFIFGY